MLTFENGMDYRAREFDAPTVARFRINATEYRYCVIGTQYGHIHTISGDVRTWRSYSGARRAARNYVGL